MTGNGQAKFPDQASMSVQVKTAGLTVVTDMVFAGGKIYVKDPSTGSFMPSPGSDALSQFTNQADPLSTAAILKTAQSVKTWAIRP